jgi:hypothetical protein
MFFATQGATVESDTYVVHSGLARCLAATICVRKRALLLQSTVFNTMLALSLKCEIISAGPFVNDQ